MKPVLFWAVMAACAILAVSPAPAAGADGAGQAAAQAQAAPVTAQDEIKELKSRVAAQQEQIDALRKMLQEQQKLLEKAFPAEFAPAGPVPVAEGNGAVPPAPPPAAAAASGPALPESSPVSAGLSFALGGATLTPIGFIDFSQVWRSGTVTSGLPTNFAGIPFDDTVNGQRRQTLSTAANSRLGVRLDTRVHGFNILGMVETDFLGYVPGNALTTTNAYGLRLRLAFADLRRGGWELLAGQAWSLLTPGRKGISPVPGELFLTQNLDPNLQVGLTWARIPQIRAVYHPKDNLALAVSFENGDAYAGGSGGSDTIKLPEALAPNYFGQLDLGAGGVGTANPNSEMIAKIAFDPKVGERSLHLELAGLLNRFSFYNPLNDRHFSATGGGVSFSAGIEAVRNLTVYTSNFYSSGGGRWIFGQGPALIIKGDGDPSLVHAMSTVDGLEYQAMPGLMLYAYYGGTYIGRNTAIDPADGNLVGWGFEGSPGTQNRSIQEITAGFTSVFWKNPNYGSFQFSGQFSWLKRNPWHADSNQDRSARLNMIYLDLRYMLPGAPPPTPK